MYLDAYYYSNAPRVAEITRGAVIPAHIHHGAKVFLTERQWRYFGSPTGNAIQVLIFIGAAVLGALLNRRWKVLKNPGDAD